MSRTHRVALALGLLCSACAADGNPPQRNEATAVETVSVAAVRETAPVTSPGDAADDPAIWRNPIDPAKSLIVATDKEWGLNVYDLSGALLDSTPAGLVNNVDLRADVRIDGRPGVLVVATDRSDKATGQLALYELESSSARLRHLIHVAVESDGVGKVYGFCLWRRSAEQLFAFIAFNNGDVRQYLLDVSDGGASAKMVRDIRLASQTEGCVADDRTGLLYVGEEERGVWRMSADPDATDAPVLIAPVDGVRLIADVEGLAILPEGKAGGYLIASSQADSTRDPDDSGYAAYDLQTGRFVRRFRVTGSGSVDGATDTDGIEFASGNFGAPFEGGIFIVQDGDNAPDNQNFKLVPGGDVKKAIKDR